jgi:hypothetical protein
MKDKFLQISKKMGKIWEMEKNSIKVYTYQLKISKTEIYDICLKLPT